MLPAELLESTGQGRFPPLVSWPNVNRQEQFLSPATTLPSSYEYFLHSNSQAGVQTPEKRQYTGSSELTQASRMICQHEPEPICLVSRNLRKYGDQLFHLQLKASSYQVLFLKLSQEEFLPIANFIRSPFWLLKLEKDDRNWVILSRVIAPSIITSI